MNKQSSTFRYGSIAASIAAGLALPFCYAPYSYFWLTLPLLTFWLFSLSLQPLSHGQWFRRGYLFAFSSFAVGLSWVSHSMTVFGGMSGWAAAGLMALLVAYLSLYPALSLYLFARFKRRNPLADYVILLPLFWLFGEWLRGTLLTGFPWLALGYSQIEGPFSGYAALSGMSSISTLLMMCAGALVLVLQRRVSPLWALLPAFIIGSGQALTSQQWTHSSKTEFVSIVQGNIAQENKWQDAWFKPTIDRYLDLSEQAKAPIMIWPESAIAEYEHRVPGLLDALTLWGKTRNSEIITGIIYRDPQSAGIYNSLVVLGDKPNYHPDSTQRYFKHQLLPIGEFVPFEHWLRRYGDFFNLPMSSFTRGADTQPNLQVKGLNLAANICYEIAFETLLRNNIHPDTDALLTVSDDSWFGPTDGPYQHLAIAQMRALEFQRPVLRATNTGHSAFIAPDGSLTQLLPAEVPTVASVAVEFRRGSTPFQQWGYWPLWILMALAGLLALRAKAHYPKRRLIL